MVWRNDCLNGRGSSETRGRGAAIALRQRTASAFGMVAGAIFAALLCASAWIVPSYAADDADASAQVEASSSALSAFQSAAWANAAPDVVPYIGEAETDADLLASSSARMSNVTSAQAYERMLALRGEYYEGRPWTNDNYYESSALRQGGYGCHGFALILSDTAFGDNPGIRYTDIGAIRVGDILRVNYDTHTVVALQVYGDGIVVAEGNYNSSIHWGRYISYSELANGFEYGITRYVDAPVACEHVFRSYVVQQPTCATPGVRHFTCEKCLYAYNEEIPATGVHTPGAWRITVAPSHDHEGLEQQFCEVCGAVVESRSIDKLDPSESEKYLLADASVWASDCAYDGRGSSLPEVRVTYAGKVLREGVDFSQGRITRVYRSNGTGYGKVVLRGLGDYLGEAEAEFSIYTPDECLFIDVARGGWPFNAVVYASTYGLMKGYGDSGYFGPDDLLTRAQAASVLWRYFCPDDYAGYNQALAKNETDLPDVESGEFYTEAANWAYKNRIITGVNLGGGAYAFDPQGTVTREQLCVMVARAAERFCGAQVKGADTAKLNAAPDASSVDSWARTEVAWALNEAVVNGVGGEGGPIAPVDGVSRAVMATVMMNAIESGAIAK